MASPYFSSFRELMDKWDEAASMFLENDLCMFFKKDGVVYGATEMGRIPYARMKNPSSEEDKIWAKDGSFPVYNLEKYSDSDKSMSLFHKSDLKSLEVLTQEKAEKELRKKGKKIPVIQEDDTEPEKTYGEE